MILHLALTINMNDSIERFERRRAMTGIGGFFVDHAMIYQWLDAIIVDAVTLLDGTTSTVRLKESREPASWPVLLRGGT